MTYLIIVLHKTDIRHTSYYNVQEIGLSRALTKQGFKCTVLYCVPELKEIIKEKAGDSDILYVPSKAVGIHCRFDWNLILKLGPDIVQINADNQIFAPDLAVFLKKHDIRYHFYLGVTRTNSSNPVKKAIMDCLYKRNIREYRRSKCFAKTPDTLQTLADSGVKDVTLAPVGLDTEVIPEITGDRNSIRQKLNLPAGKKILLFVGKLEEYKNPMMAVKLLKGLSEEHILVVIGKGYLEPSMREYAAQNGLEDRIIFKGQIPNSEVQEYYYACDYSLNFNTQEIFGMSILEAMYQGCTVIALHAPGPDYIIENDRNGFLADNTDEMKSMIVHNKKIPPNEAKKRIIDAFTWENTAKIIKEQI